MANYALTVTPKFTPFTYDELIKPIETYQKVYDTYDATYEKALEDASKFASLNAETDPEAYQRYQNYLQNIQNQRDVLFRTGLSNDSRRGFQNLRNTYATEIKPMEIAYDKKIEDIKNYDKMMMTNPQMRAVRNPHETTLGEYMSNPDLGNRYVDLNAVHKAAVDTFAKARQTYINKNNLNPYTYQIITRYGETPDAIMRGLQEATQDGDPKTRSQAAQIITMVRDSVRNQFGYDDIDNDSVKQDIDNTIYNSAWSLQGQDDVKYVENYGARLAAQRAESDRKAEQDYNYWKKKADYEANLKAQQERLKSASNSFITEPNFTGATGVENKVSFLDPARKPNSTFMEGPKDFQGENAYNFLSNSDNAAIKAKDIISEKDLSALQSYYQKLKNTPYIDTGWGSDDRSNNENYKEINKILKSYGLVYNSKDDTIYSNKSALEKINYGKSSLVTNSGIDSFIETDLSNQQKTKTNYQSAIMEYNNQIKKAKELYNTYRQKYGDIYTANVDNDDDLINTVNKYIALENQGKSNSMYQSTISLSSENKNTLINNILSTIVRNGEENIQKIDVKKGTQEKVENTDLPSDKNKITNVQITSTGDVLLTDDSNNVFRINDAIDNIQKLSIPFNAVMSNLNLTLGKDKQYVQGSDNVFSANANQIEKLKGGYKKVVAKDTTSTGTHLTTYIFDNAGNLVASINDEDILAGGTAAGTTAKVLMRQFGNDLVYSLVPGVK